MNERIRVLAERSTDKWIGGEFFDREKFAQLIVQECAGVAELSMPINSYPDDRLTVKNNVLKHFGVEETPITTVTAEMVKKLREETDHPLMECKKALYVCNGDREQAKRWLLDQRYYRNKI